MAILHEFLWGQEFGGDGKFCCITSEEGHNQVSVEKLMTALGFYVLIGGGGNGECRIHLYIKIKAWPTITSSNNL